MAWPFSGNWDGKNAASLATICAACMRAVNERVYVYINTSDHTGSLINFKKADGTYANYPTAAQLAGMQLHGDDMRFNINLIFSGLTTLANSGHFYTDDTFATAWSWVNLKAHIGYGNVDTATGSVLNAYKWLLMKEACDHLIYYGTDNINVDSWSFVVATYSNYYSSGSQAFANRGDNADSPLNPISYVLLQDNASYPNNWYCVDYKQLTATYPTSDYSVIPDNCIVYVDGVNWNTSFGSLQESCIAACGLKSVVIGPGSGFGGLQSALPSAITFAADTDIDQGFIYSDPFNSGSGYVVGGMSYTVPYLTDQAMFVGSDLSKSAYLLTDQA